MLKVEGIDSFYGKAQVLFGVSLEVGEGRIVGLFGRNGAGKTTTFRSIMNLRPVTTRGEIRYKGESLAGLPPYRIAQRGIGFVPEDRCIFPNLTVEKNLVVGRKPGPDGRVRFDIDHALEIFPALKPLLPKMGTQLSGGEQQMLTIARTLLGNPDLVLLDEPTEGLAPVIAQNLMESIFRIKSELNVSIVVVEQFSPEVLDYLDSCYVMEMGHMIWHGEPKALKADEELQRKLLGVGPGGEGVGGNGAQTQGG